jgi:hypothetical protein
VGAPVPFGVGYGDEPSKWPQKPLASTASWKRKTKIAQLLPEGSSLGMLVGRESESEAVVMDVDIWKE